MDINRLCCLCSPVARCFRSLKSGVKCGQMIAIVIPRFSGKSQFINSVNSTNYLLLDLEENVTLEMTEVERTKLQGLIGNASYNLHYFPICRDYLKKIRDNHKNKAILVFCSDMELVKYLGISKIYAYAPSNQLSERIKADLPEADRAKYEQSRLELLIHNKEKMFSFNDFNQLTQSIINKFKLTMKL